MRDQSDAPDLRADPARYDPAVAHPGDPGWPTVEQAAPFGTHAFSLPGHIQAAAEPDAWDAGPVMPNDPADIPVGPSAPAAPPPSSIGDTLNPPSEHADQPPQDGAPSAGTPVESTPGAPEPGTGTPGSGDVPGDGSDGTGEPSDDTAEPTILPDHGSAEDQHGGGQGGEQGGGTGESRGRWDVDLERLQGFAIAVSAARTGLGAVQTLVSQMQGEAYTPKLGTSPVGQQLARKFDDRLNSDSGLRPLLAEAVRRMDEFILSAETVRDAYAESEAEAEQLMRRTGPGE